MEPHIARGEVELLVVGRIIGYVHLAVGACDAAVFLQHHSRVVIQPWSPFLEKRGNDDYAELLCQLTEESGGWTRNGLSKVEVPDILCLTEVE